MRIPAAAVVLLLAAATSAPLRAQAIDIGLTVNAPLAPAQIGQQCGSVICGTVFNHRERRGGAVTFNHGSAPSSPFLFGIAFPGTCTQFPGIDNVLMLNLVTTQIMAVGVSSAPPFVPTPCGQGVASVTLPIPLGAPAGLVVRIQNFGLSNSGPFAFGPAIDLTIT